MFTKDPPASLPRERFNQIVLAGSQLSLASQQFRKTRNSFQELINQLGKDFPREGWLAALSSQKPIPFGLINALVTIRDEGDLDAVCSDLKINYYLLEPNDPTESDNCRLPAGMYEDLFSRRFQLKEGQAYVFAERTFTYLTTENYGNTPLESDFYLAEPTDISPIN